MTGHLLLYASRYLTIPLHRWQVETYLSKYLKGASSGILRIHGELSQVVDNASGFLPNLAHMLAPGAKGQ